MDDAQIEKQLEQLVSKMSTPGFILFGRQAAGEPMKVTYSVNGKAKKKDVLLSILTALQDLIVKLVS